LLLTSKLTLSTASKNTCTHHVQARMHCQQHKPMLTSLCARNKRNPLLLSCRLLCIRLS
jgi:hypothetical protein